MDNCILKHFRPLNTMIQPDKFWTNLEDIDDILKLNIPLKPATMLALRTLQHL